MIVVLASGTHALRMHLQRMKFTAKKRNYLCTISVTRSNAVCVTISIFIERKISQTYMDSIFITRAYKLCLMQMQTHAQSHTRSYTTCISIDVQLDFCPKSECLVLFKLYRQITIDKQYCIIPQYYQYLCTKFRFSVYYAEFVFKQTYLNLCTITKHIQMNFDLHACNETMSKDILFFSLETFYIVFL